MKTSQIEFSASALSLFIKEKPLDATEAKQTALLAFAEINKKLWNLPEDTIKSVQAINFVYDGKERGVKIYVKFYDKKGLTNDYWFTFLYSENQGKFLEYCIDTYFYISQNL